jgi:hypothetical protein
MQHNAELRLRTIWHSAEFLKNSLPLHFYIYNGNDVTVEIFLEDK